MAQTVAITTTNAAPDVSNQTLAGLEDQPISGAVQALDSDGDALSFAVATGPAHGSVEIDAVTGAFTYSGATDWSGADSFTVAVGDGHGGVTESTVSLGVAGVADAPTLVVTSAVTVDASQTIYADPNGGTVVGGAGADIIYGSAGNDMLFGGGSDATSGAISGTVSLPLDIRASLGDRDGSEVLTVAVAGLPAGAQLSAGAVQGDGSWLLQAGDLDQLTLTSSDTTPLTLTVTATAVEADSGDVASVSATMSITPQAAGGADLIFGGDGNDVITGGKGRDVLHGDAGDDLIKAGSGNDVVEGGAGNDTVYGGAGNDVLTGNDGNDRVYGGIGNDTVIAGLGDQTLHGGSGFDTLDFSQFTGAIVFDSGKHSVDVLGPDGNIVYAMAVTSFEKFIGSDFGNIFETTTKAGMQFVGGDGDDVFHIKGSNQILTGGEGSDTYQWMRTTVAGSSPNGAGERITDFQVGEDHLDMSDFLKGQGIKNAQFSDVVRVHESSDGKGTIVQGLVGGQWHDVAVLEGVHQATVNDLGLI